MRKATELREEEKKKGIENRLFCDYESSGLKGLKPGDGMWGDSEPMKTEYFTEYGVHCWKLGSQIVEI